MYVSRIQNNNCNMVFGINTQRPTKEAVKTGTQIKDAADKYIHVDLTPFKQACQVYNDYLRRLAQETILHDRIGRVLNIGH